jgi:hypothetical protein
MPKALEDFTLGFHGTIAAGQEVPATYTTPAGTFDTDFESLAERGLVAGVPKAKAKAAE